MRKSSVQLGGLLIGLASLALVIGLGIAHAQGPSGSAQPGKQLPTHPSVSVVHKQTKPTSYITSCPMPLPKPGVVQEGFPNSDPTYAFQSAAIGVSGGQAYAILAGYARSNPTQGVISVQSISLDPCKAFVSQLGKPASQASVAIPVWNVPSPEGTITLTGVSGSTVSYITAGGKAGHFDYMTKAFLP
jgi:hypothetical protein